jgi:hypothetical protein
LKLVTTSTRNRKRERVRSRPAEGFRNIFGV